VAAETLLRARRAVVGGREAAVAVRIRDGVITDLSAYDVDPGAADVVVLADDEVLLPGLVDTHVHVNEPGRTDWEGFVSATRAAAAGGVTTIVDMPLNSIPPTTTVAALEAKRAVARGRTYVDVGFWGGAVPGNVPDLEPLHTAGVLPSARQRLALPQSACALATQLTSAPLRCTTCARAPVLRAVRSTRSTARSSAASGRLARKAA
jgi:allantoinase